MKPEGHGDALKRPLLNHEPCPLPRLFRRLENQAHRACKGFAAGHQDFGRAHQHGGMGVMPAGMHHARHLRGKGKPCPLSDAQGVDVGAQGHPRAGSSPLNLRNQAGRLGQPVGDAKSVHLGRQAACGFKFLHAGFRVLVQCAAHFHHFRINALCQCVDLVHGSSFDRRFLFFVRRSPHLPEAAGSCPLFPAKTACSLSIQGAFDGHAAPWAACPLPIEGSIS